MQSDKELMQMALQALQESKPIDINDPTAFYRSAHAIEALRAALAQPEPEPVAWMYNGNLHEFDPSDWAVNKVTPLYTAPPEREWHGLTDKAYEAIAERYVTNCYFDTLKFARAIESKLRRKNT